MFFDLFPRRQDIIRYYLNSALNKLLKEGRVVLVKYPYSKKRMVI